jgi:hypothetical protein
MSRQRSRNVNNSKVYFNEFLEQGKVAEATSHYYITVTALKSVIFGDIKWKCALGVTNSNHAQYYYYYYYYADYSFIVLPLFETTKFL